MNASLLGGVSVFFQLRLANQRLGYHSHSYGLEDHVILENSDLGVPFQTGSVSKPCTPGEHQNSW